MDKIEIGDILVLRNDDQRLNAGVVRSITYISNELHCVWLNDENTPYHTWEIEENLHKHIKRADVV